ncbi:hypothetical protein CHLNCDRAFT_144235 [Chlorella variabilis]|uniref:RNase H type-1 domain-containing protein n=1 Tax=Chlorella variabilis TaxID=554065 RepID=E1ZC82_CHLVA|nr:hypothetical protein CHLNCDRAFT_144235 [Chlorella variabilis]EFN56765.1 hypothetical protein CHLNCDRAFT_144235 [Chlorella variabilis]|eukprot:XP_005848867.1 hypothetical protein CHLNCDRAFT_144235 [Chlorella variabilis]
MQPGGLQDALNFQLLTAWQPGPVLGLDVQDWINDLQQALAGQRHLRFPRGSNVYTDGSKLTSGAIGAGVITETGPGTAEQQEVKPDGHDLQLNTVPYAELVAALHGIAAAPPGAARHIFLDASTAMWLTRMALHERVRTKKHKGILTHIVAQLCSRAMMQGTTFALHKVRAHIGVLGNELADAAAKQAARAAEGDANVTFYTDAPAGTPRLGASWPRRIARPRNEDEEVSTYWLADSLPSVKKQVARVFQNRIVASTRSVMFTLLLQQREENPDAPGMQPESAAAIWTSQFTFAQRRAALLLRFNARPFREQLHGFDAARHPSALCDLCTAQVEETQAHALGGCQQPNTHALVCSRHGGTVHLLHEAIQKGVSFHTMADAEGQCQFVEPAWLLPEQQRPTTPDVLVVLGLLAASAGPPDRQQHDICMLECFHTYDANLAGRWATKRSSHDALQSMLAAPGRWRSAAQAAIGVSHSGLVTGNFMAVMHAQIGRIPAGGPQRTFTSDDAYPAEVAAR